MPEKLKSLVGDDTIFIAGLLIITAVGSFGLGRASVGSESVHASSVPAVTLVASPIQVPTPIIASSTRLVPTDPPVMLPTSGGYVASKSGTKYHLTTCPGAKQIKDENKIYFTTATDASAAGYTKAANCPGL